MSDSALPIDDTPDDSSWMRPAFDGDAIPQLSHLLIELSTRFILAAPQDLADNIHSALERVGQCVDVDRSFLYLFDSNVEYATLAHEWQRDPSYSLSARVGKLLVTDHHWSHQRMLNNQIVAVSRPGDLPPAADVLRRHVESLGIKRFIYIPVWGANRLLGYVGLANMRRTGPWPEQTQQLLRVLAAIIANLYERAHAEATLQASEQRYRQLVEDQHELVVQWLPGGLPTMVNEAACQFTGLTRQQLSERSVFCDIHADDLPAVHKKIGALTPQSPSAIDRHRTRRHDGEYRWLEWSDRAFFDEAGQVVEYQSVGRDITDERLASERLDYLRRFDSLLVQLSNHFIKHPIDAAESDLMAALRRVAEFTGFDRASLYLLDSREQIAKLRSAWSAPGISTYPSQLAELRMADYPWSVEQFRRGEVLWVTRLADLPPEADQAYSRFASLGIKSFVRVPVVDGGQLKGFFGLSSLTGHRDIAHDTIALLRLLSEIFVNALERRAAEIDVAASEERLRQVVEAMTEYYFDWNFAANRIFVNRRWIELFGSDEKGNYQTRQQREMPIHPDDLADVRRLLDAHLTGAADRYEAEFRLRDRAGNYHWMQSLGRVVQRDRHGKALRMVGISRDITHEMAKEERMRALEEQMKDMSRLATMGEVVAGIAHEINQPLHAAATFAAAARTALARGDDDACERASEMLGKIGDQVHRAAEIIRRMREFCRPRQQNMKLFDLHGVVREAAALHAMTHRTQRVRIEFDFAEPMPPLTGDPVQIEQVVLNLMRNAVQAVIARGNQQPRVVVRTRELHDDIELEIEDNGLGPPPDKPLEQLFDTFVTTKTEGMGMGLAICKSIVEAHHGTIRAQGNGWGGMSFTVWLPHRRENRT
jgi:PAS domain S-box-containing protein